MLYWIINSRKSRMEIFEKKIKVAANHLDELNHVNNVVYVQWVNEIAAEHWNAVTTPDIERLYFWVLINHEIQYKGQAFSGDEVLVKTYFSDTSELKSNRIVEFYREGKLITKSKTTWCLMDRGTNRVCRIAEPVSEIILKYLQ